MTTIVGIKAEKGKNGVILASDWTGTYSSNQTKTEVKKLYVSKNRDFALGMSGSYDKLYNEFLYDALNGKIDVKKAVKQGYFPELAKLNIHYRWENKITDDSINSLLIASNFDKKPELYTCWPLGKVEGRTWTTIGSGSPFAEKHIAVYASVFIPDKLSLKDGINLAVDSLNEASKDLYTSGLNMVIITSKEIKEYGNLIKEHISAAKNRAIKKIIKDIK